MWGFARPSDLRARVAGAVAAAALALGAAAPAAAGGDAPARVVSINLCTDQLAMLLAGPEQLLSVSYLASDPRSSSMVAEAAGYRANRGRAEDVFLLAPDLVLTGTWTTPATVAMLERLGVRVARFPLARSLDEVGGLIRRMGAALGREAAAEAEARAFEARLAELRQAGGRAAARRAALYYANGHTSGERALAGQILAAAGLANVAGELGLSEGGHLPLERLVLAAPDLIVTAERFEGASRAEEILLHPVLAGLAERATTSADWVCGTPAVLRAIEGLAR